MSDQITIRKSTPEERRAKWPAIVHGGPRIRIPTYLVVPLPHDDRVTCVFGIPQGGDTRAEAVFWAERAASNNGFDFIPPAGWENVEGRLPS